jgi:CBS domain-containing protein
VIQNMGDQQVRRLPVLNRDKRLVGIVSFGDLALKVKPQSSGQAIGQVSEPGGQRAQTAH